MQTIYQTGPYTLKIVKFHLQSFMSFLGVILLSINCFSAEEKSSVNPEKAESTGLRFAWPTPVTFQVEERVSRQSNEFTVRYTLNLDNSKDELALKWLDADVLEVNGEKVDSPEKRQMIDPVRSMYLTMPPFRISKRGEFLGALNAKESIQATNKQLDKINPNRTDKDREEFLRVMQQPEAIRVYEQILSQYWTDWVAEWIGLELQVGEVTTGTTKITVAPGAKPVPTNVRFEHVRFTNADTNLLHLKCLQISEGKELATAMRAMLDGLDKATGKAEGGTNQISAIKREVKMEVITDSETLKPSWAKRELNVSLDISGEGKTTSREVHEYHFIWERPDGRAKESLAK